MMQVADYRYAPEVVDLASRFHYASLGVEKTVDDLRVAIQQVIDSGYILEAFDCQMIHASLAIEMLEGRMKVHSPISYPLGNMTMRKKLRDLDFMKQVGIEDSCWCLNYGDILDHQYAKVEAEVRQSVEANAGQIPMAYVIQAPLLTNDEIVDACKAVQNGGGERIKVATGYGWGTDFEHVALIRRVFKYQLDIHPSGNIRTLEQVDEYIKMGVHIIHSIACLDILQAYVNRRWAERNQEL